MSAQEFERLSGWRALGVVVMFSVGFFRIISGISYLADSHKVNDLSLGLFGDNLWAWGIWDLGIAIVALFAGYSLLRQRDVREGSRLSLGGARDREQLPGHGASTMVRRRDDHARCPRGLWRSEVVRGGCTRRGRVVVVGADGLKAVHRWPFVACRL
jgi:hypothetical protein